MPMIDLNTMKDLTLAAGVTARVVHAGNLSVAHVRFTPGAVAPLHTHPHEQVANVIAGELELTVDGQTHVLTPGQAMILPPMIPHSARAKTACYLIDVFHPVREDMRALAQAVADSAR